MRIWRRKTFNELLLFTLISIDQLRYAGKTNGVIAIVENVEANCPHRDGVSAEAIFMINMIPDGRQQRV